MAFSIDDVVKELTKRTLTAVSTEALAFTLFGTVLFFGAGTSSFTVLSGMVTTDKVEIYSSAILSHFAMAFVVVLVTTMAYRIFRRFTLRYALRPSKVQEFEARVNSMASELEIDEENKRDARSLAYLADQSNKRAKEFQRREMVARFCCYSAIYVLFAQALSPKIWNVDLVLILILFLGFISLTLSNAIFFVSRVAPPVLLWARFLGQPVDILEEMVGPEYRDRHLK